MTQCHNASASQGLHFFLSLSLIVELEDARLHAEEEEAKDSSRDDGSCGMISLFCIATLFEGSFTQRYCNHIHFRCSPGSRCCRWYNKPELSRQRTGWIGRGGWGWNKPVTCKSVNKGLINVCNDETMKRDYLAPVKCVNDNSRIQRGDITGETKSRSSKLLKEGDTLQIRRIAAALRRDLGTCHFLCFVTFTFGNRRPMPLPPESKSKGE